MSNKKRNDNSMSALDIDDKPFTAKSDDELLSSCKLDHLTATHCQETLTMLRSNLNAFQRHKLDIGECREVTADIPLTDNYPPKSFVNMYRFHSNIKNMHNF